jgi:hypothetical protein
MSEACSTDQEKRQLVLTNERPIAVDFEEKMEPKWRSHAASSARRAMPCKPQAE